KNAAVVAAPDLASFIGKKIQAITGAPTPACPPPPINATGVGSNGMTVPRPTACTALLGISGARTISNGGPAIEIATVPANHDSSAAAATLSEPLKTELTADGLTAYLDPANGFVVKFTNGLSVYLTGDTGLTAEMDTIIREFYRPSLMIINIGDLFTTGPEAAAVAATRLVRPRAVIPSHVNDAARRCPSSDRRRMPRDPRRVPASPVRFDCPCAARAPRSTSRSSGPPRAACRTRPSPRALARSRRVERCRRRCRSES